MGTIFLDFDKGTLELTGLTDEHLEILPKSIQWDERTRTHRAPGMAYREVVLTLHRKKIPYEDRARDFQPIDVSIAETLTPRAYQEEAIAAWNKQRGQGVVVLPTGAGKTILAVLLIAQVKRPACIHVPTIDLMHQWHGVLSRFLDVEVGMMGGGFHEMKTITVTTYDSALLHVTHRGNRFGFVIYDECHRMGGDQYRMLAMSSPAPYRLGLTATPERSDGNEQRLYNLIGPLCYRAFVHELTGGTLAPYEVVTIEVEMKAEEREAYEEASYTYTEFLKNNNISISSKRGWQNFLYQASRTPIGRMAFKAWLTQKQLAQASSAKEEWVWDLIMQHHNDRILVFTQDNEMAYRLGRRYLLPVLTHQTRPKEREAFLNAFRQGDYPVLVTSKVLNEGVDVPEANIAIVVSGSGSVREHVQRLGRILRGQPGKTAILYELVSSQTREYYVNQRRRRHHAYQRSDSVQDPQG